MFTVTFGRHEPVVNKALRIITIALDHDYNPNEETPFIKIFSTLYDRLQVINLQDLTMKKVLAIKEIILFDRNVRPSYLEDHHYKLAVLLKFLLLLIRM
jgi:hypothetical protein